MPRLTRVTSGGPLGGIVSVPPSKSYTHRAVLLASLADGRSKVLNPLFSRDTNATMHACKAFGADISTGDRSIEIGGTRPKTPADVVNAENSGTTLRLMTSALSLAPGVSVITGDSSTRRRPMQPLIDTLGNMGASVRSTRGNGCAPIVVEGGGIRGGQASMSGSVSSQFVSSLLAAAPLSKEGISLTVERAVSRPYIDATISAARTFGVEVKRDGYTKFEVDGGRMFKPADFNVPGDFSSASFIAAAVALVGGQVQIEGLDPSLPQGDSRIAEILTAMGARVTRNSRSIEVKSDGDLLRGGSFDLSDTPDLLPVVSVLALRCSSPVEVTGVAHARFKETDRIRVLSSELAKAGARVEEKDDGIRVSPGALRRSVLDAHDDHRMFMAFSLVSMLLPEGLQISGVESLDVSYPNFLRDLEGLGARVEVAS